VDIPTEVEFVQADGLGLADVLPAGHFAGVLRPNVRLVGGAYWDFIDHHVALTEHNLVAAPEGAGLRTIEVRTRFLPYSTMGGLPKHPAMVRAYLAFPPAWRLLWKQTLYVGERPG
jgi:hypothetical protein